MHKTLSLTARLRRVKLFLTDVDGVIGSRGQNGNRRRRQRTERQRRSIFQPRVGAKRLPWVGDHKSINPEGVASRPPTFRLQPLQGCGHLWPRTQGSLRCRQPWAECLNAVGVPGTVALGVAASRMETRNFKRSTSNAQRPKLNARGLVER